MRTLFVALCLAVLAVSAQAQSPAIHHVKAYVAAVNAGDVASVQRFRDSSITPAFADEQPLDAFVKYFADQKRTTGGVELVDIRIKPGLAEAALRDRIFGGLRGVKMVLEPGSNRVRELEPGPAPAWMAVSGPPRSPGAIATRARELVRRGCEAEIFSGAVLVAHGDTVLSETACGEANRRYGVANTPATRFNLGSLNKMVTAVAVMQLVEAGKIKLDDRLSKYVDESWLPRAVADQITIAQLLSHTSGLGDFKDDGWEDRPRDAYRELADFKPLVRTEQLAFPPGSKFEYSNTGMLMLGVVIEAASGENYYGYVQRHIYDVAGMSSTGSAPMDEPVADLAMGYWRGPQGWRENSFRQLFRGGPAGGGYSTVGDLYRFARALQIGKLVSDASLDTLWTDHPPHGYGAGFEIQTTAAGKIVGHSGAARGVSARLSLYLDKDYVVVVLSNLDRGGPGLNDVLTAEIASAGKR